MPTESIELCETGLEVIDLTEDDAFRARRLHARDAVVQLAGVKRIARAFVDAPESILQELVHSAVELCGADSAAISLVKEDGTDEEYYHWVASSGVYAGFLNAMLPRYPSACGLCLERGRPQLIRVHARFFEILGVEAPPVTDGLLLPWRVDTTQGTIFVMAHERSEAFDTEDLRTMEMLADFAAMGVRQIRQRGRLMQQASAAASAAMAHELAHEINNPLQSITNLLFLAANGEAADSKRGLALELGDDVARLNDVARRLLTLPKVKLDALKTGER
jgi:GAF domain-containing protein